MNCFACGEYIEKNGQYMMIDDDRIICHKCELANTMTLCDICGVASINSWMDYIMYEEEDYEDDFVCPTCYKKHYGRYPHDYKPYPIFHSLFNVDRKHCLHIGVELELESYDCDCNCNKYTDAMNDISEDKFYLKMDGSLSDKCGAETISNPMTLPVALKEWKKVFQIINKYNMCSNEDTGLHFHLDKEFLDERQIRNIDYIVNTFTDSIKKFGGRNIVNHRWASKVNKSVEHWGIKTPIDYKYNAVNFTKNTLELRCFDSTNSWEKFSYILVGVFALVEMAQVHTFNYFENMNDADFWIAFKNYISKYMKQNNVSLD